MICLTIIGFEKSKGGKSHPVKGGVLVHQRDEALVRDVIKLIIRSLSLKFILY